MELKVTTLEGKSAGRFPAPPLGAADKGYPPVCSAPGHYVFER